MVSINTKLFYEWYVKWYKGILNDMTIMISLPNELQPFREKNVVILELFKPTSDFVDTEPYLKEMLEKADELGIIIYHDPEPKYNQKNTRLFYLWLYKQYGFELTQNHVFMKRLPKKTNIQTNEVAI